jgi:hypothetical protein
LFLLALLESGCAPSGPSSDNYVPVGRLADDYRDIVKADLARTLADPKGATYTFEGSPGIINLGKHFVGVHYAWIVCGTVNAKDPTDGLVETKPFVSVVNRKVVVEREIDSARAKECAKEHSS